MGRRGGFSIDRGGALAIIEAFLAAVVLVMFSNAIIGPVFDPLETGGAETPWLRLIWLPAYAVILLLVLIRLPRFFAHWLPTLLMMALVGWAAASLAWSMDPQTSGRRVIALFFTTLFGVYLSAAFDGKRFAELLAGTFTALAVGSWIACLAVPSLGIDHAANAGAWKGLWYEKNQMGALMSYGALTAVIAAGLSRERRWFWLAAAAICIGLILMSRSKTALVTFVVALGVLAVLRLARASPAAGVGATWLGVTFGGLGAAFAALAPTAFYHALGKDPTLTGRTDIWNMVERWSAQAPLFGYGYAAFWTLESTPAKYIRKALQWPVPTAHNGWLDLRIQLGWIGVALVGAVMAGAAVAALLRVQKLKDGYWAAAFLVIFAVSSLSESLLLQQNNLSWTLCVAAMTRLLGPTPAGAGALMPARFLGAPAVPAPREPFDAPFDDDWREDMAPFPYADEEFTPGLPSAERA